MLAMTLINDGRQSFKNMVGIGSNGQEFEEQLKINFDNSDSLTLLKKLSEGGKDNSDAVEVTSTSSNFDERLSRIVDILVRKYEENLSASC
ncbi:hypothetical protein SNE40_012710 [Patella caerulea]|uniref:Uncharacterized protein n=1 Tax=Patella caerulea TaxID=87958 RepID=A0AAN8JQ81_PATCE